MKKLLTYTSLLLMIISCRTKNNDNIIQGEIFIKLIDVRNVVSNIPDDKLEEVKKSIANADQTNLTESEKKSSNYFKILLEKNLIKKPFFKLKISSGKIINVYTTKTEYSKLQKILENFDKYKEKIKVEFEGKKISDGVFDSDGIFDQPIYLADKIISIEKTDGKTDWKK